MRKSIGVDVGGTNLKIATVSETGDHENLTYSETEASNGPKHVIQKIKSEIDKQLTNTKDIVGIGVGCAGQVDVNTGIVYDPPNLPGWQKEDLKKIIEEEFNLPTVVDNDANVAALAESILGTGRDSSYFMLVTLGTGVGSGLVFNKKVYHGKVGTAGEFGHFTVNFDGPRCNCGQNGCIERYVGSQWIVEQAMDLLPQYSKTKVNKLEKKELTPKHIADLANDGDELCVRVMNDVGKHLGVALGSVINLLNLDMIAIGGGISNAGTVLFEPLELSLQEHSMSVPKSIVKIRRAELGEYAGIIGAGLLVFSNLT